MIVTIFVIIALLVLYLIVFHYFKEWIHRKVANANSENDMVDFYKKNPSAKQYVGEEHSWEPTFNLEHRGLKVFNIPFVPEDNEIFYIENNYDEEANLFIKENIDLIMDVPLEVTVELGRTSKSIKEILEFSPGTIIELDKIAGEPIDVLVNGKLVAKGEVVVIEESFGIRVTDIIKQ